MKNSLIFYAVVAAGIVALAVGAFYLSSGHHPFRAYVGMGAGVFFVIAGIAGMVVVKPKATIAAK